jgi:hypothetical protein
LSTSHRPARATVLAVAIASTLSAAPLKKESAQIEGIVGVSLHDAYVTVRVVPCDENQPHRRALLRTTDGGKTWNEVWTSHGPASLAVAVRQGSELVFVGTEGEEGPDLNPFALVRVGKRWEQRTIRKGDSKLEAVHQDGRSLTVLIQHIDIHSEEWTGPTVAYESKNGGRSWVRSKKQPHPGSNAIPPISEISREWRIRHSDDGNFLVEMTGTGGAHVVTRFAATACDAG